jgi:hypothetical protein
MQSKFIKLANGKVTIVSPADYPKLNRYHWFALNDHRRYYAVRVENKKLIRMHRQILNAPQGLLCDHINHDTLDNRRCNLRLCTAVENCRNRRPSRNSRSSYKGVTFHRRNKKWLARILHNGRRLHIGCYEYELDAAIAYDDTAIELFGEFAYLNHNHRPEIKTWLAQSRLPFT